jgi:hypothetical protein
MKLMDLQKRFCHIIKQYPEFVSKEQKADIGGFEKWHKEKLLR